jgi:chromate transporter
MIKTLAILFYEMAKIALFVVGGGYAIIAVMDDVFSRKLGWIKEGEIVDNLPVIQMAPGLIAGNAAIYIGRKIAGTIGAAVGLVAVAVPSLVIFTFISVYFGELPFGCAYLEAVFKGLRSALTGIVLATIVRSWTKSVKDVFGYVMMVLTTVLIFAGVNPAVVLVSAAVTGIVFNSVKSRKGKIVFRSSALISIPLVFLKYGSLAFGGGYVLVPMYVNDFVGGSAPYIQMSEMKFAELMALTQMTPGPISVNAATFFGYQMGGIPGAIVATVCILIPGFILLQIALVSLERYSSSTVVQGFLMGIRPGAMSLMLSALAMFAKLSVFNRFEGVGDFSLNFWGLGIVAFSAVAFYSKRLSAMSIVVISALAALFCDICI